MIQSKTPKFDKALAEYFANLELDEKGGQTRKCRFSGNEFYVRPEDISLYKMFKVPLPTLEHMERRRKRFAFHNSYNLLKTKSAHSGKEIVSIYPRDTKFNIYEYRFWLGDGWDPMDYGLDADINNSIFDQFHKLRLAVPRPSLISDVSNLNSDYSNVSLGLKDCYICFDTKNGEQLYYHQFGENCKNSIESWGLLRSENCYESWMIHDSFNIRNCKEVKDSMDCYFLYDCRNCNHCFMSSGLRGKKYVFRGEQLTREEYEKRISEIDFGSWGVQQKLKEEFRGLELACPRKPDRNDEKCVDMVGADYCWRSKNIYMSMWCEDSENIAYAEAGVFNKDCMDTSCGANSQLCYEVSNIWTGDNYNCRFSSHIDICRDVEYSDSCKSCEFVFGCIGLRNKKFCIFNKQYSEEEYWQKLDEIKTAMLEQGEYGEFFPPEHSPAPYRIAMATSYPGFRDFENAEKYGYDTRKIDDGSTQYAGDYIRASELPDNIKEVSDDILNKIVYDEKNGKYFRYIKPELDFYRRYNVPLPREHYSVRMQYFRETLEVRPQFRKGSCAKCGKEIETIFPEDAPETIYCRPCYFAWLG